MKKLRKSKAKRISRDYLVATRTVGSAPSRALRHLNRPQGAARCLPCEHSSLPSPSHKCSPTLPTQFYRMCSRSSLLHRLPLSSISCLPPFLPYPYFSHLISFSPAPLDSLSPSNVIPLYVNNPQITLRFWPPSL